MRVLITGGAGYIGSHMVWSMLDHGDEPVVIDRLSTGLRNAIPMDIPFYAIDIKDDHALGKVLSEHDIKSVVHFAGSASVDQSMTNPLHFYLNNTRNTQKLVNTSMKHGVENFVFSSSASVYGDPMTNAPIGENAPTFPQSPYGHSKLFSENFLTETAQTHEYFNVAILRYFNVAGADPKGRTGQMTKGSEGLIKVVSETITGQRPQMTINGTDYDTPDGTCIRDYIHVSDLANAHSATLAQLMTKGGKLLYNCGYGKGYSVRQILHEMERVTELTINQVEGPRRAGDIVKIIADNRKILAETNWQIEHDDLETILKTAYQWEQQQKQSVQQSA